MTSRLDIRQWLAAALEDEDALAERSLDDIKADLKGLDVDVDLAIAAARRLGDRQASPAVRLLAMLAAEDGSKAAPKAATARSEEGQGLNIAGHSVATPHRARLRDWFRSGSASRFLLGGSLGALAVACFLLFVASDRTPFIAPAEPLDEQGAQGFAEERAALREPRGEADPAIAAARPAPAPAAIHRTAPTSDAALPASKAAGPGRSEVAGFLAIAPSLPSDLAGFQTLPEGGLSKRLAEARRAANGRKILALAQVVAGGERRDVLLVERSAGDLQSGRRAAGISHPFFFGNWPAQVDVIPLP